MTARDLLDEAERLRKLALGGVPLVVFDRVDVAVAAQADGVHLTGDGLPISAAKQAGRGMLVGRTVSSVAEAVAAEQAGADYLVVEPVFSSHYSHGATPAGPTLVRRIKAKVHIPLLAGGGITAGNAHQVIAAGRRRRVGCLRDRRRGGHAGGGGVADGRHAARVADAAIASRSPRGIDNTHGPGRRNGDRRRFAALAAGRSGAVARLRPDALRIRRVDRQAAPGRRRLSVVDRGGQPGRAGVPPAGRAVHGSRRGNGAFGRSDPGTGRRAHQSGANDSHSRYRRRQSEGGRRAGRGQSAARPGRRRVWTDVCARSVEPEGVHDRWQCRRKLGRAAHAALRRDDQPHARARGRLARWRGDSGRRQRRRCAWLRPGGTDRRLRGHAGHRHPHLGAPGAGRRDGQDDSGRVSEHGRGQRSRGWSHRAAHRAGRDRDDGQPHHPRHRVALALGLPGGCAGRRA